MIGKERPHIATQDPAEPGFTFAGFRMEPDGSLFRGTSAIHLSPKEQAALRLLLTHASEIVTPAQLKSELWGDVHVTEESIPKCISSLRARLAPEDCIQTVYKRGYRLSAEVSRHKGGLGARVPRLAILPFETGPGFPEHLALALVDEAMDRLVNLRPSPISLIARDSVFTLARGKRTARQIGEALLADLVLTGSLRAMPAHFRLRARMIRVEDDTEIWVEDLVGDRNLASGLQMEFFDRLVFRLGGDNVSISAEAAGEPIEMHTPEQREARDLFRKARFDSQAVERHRLQDGLRHLLRATELDPSLHAAQVELAHVCCTQALFGFMSAAVAAEIVCKAAETIPGGTHHADAIMPAVGWIHFHVDRDMKGAIEAFSRCAGLPLDVWNTRLQAGFALGRRRFDEAVDLLETALRSDPFSPWLHARIAWAYHLAGRADEAQAQIAKGLEMFPGHEAVCLYGSIILSYMGDAKMAIELAADCVRRLASSDIPMSIHAYALAQGGRAEEAHAILERLDWLGRERFVLRSFNPAVHVALGQPEAAIAELRAAEQNRCPWFFQTMADPRLAPLHHHPEFERLSQILDNMEADAAPRSGPAARRGQAHKLNE